MVVSDLQSKDFVILSVRHAITKTNAPYAVVTVASTPEESCTVNIWSCPPNSTVLQGNKIQFLSIQEKDGMFSTPYSQVRCTSLPKGSPLKDLLPKVVSFEEWMDLCHNICHSEHIQLTDNDREFVTNQFNNLYSVYATKVAARSNHHAFQGGLVQHTYELLNIFYHAKPALPYKVDDFIVILGCLYHDFGKVVEYSPNSELTSEFFLEGHPCIGARALSQVLTNAGYPANLVQHARHAVLAHHGYKEYGAPVVPCTPEAFTVSICDLASGWGTCFNSPDGTTINVFGTTTKVQHLKR